MILDGGGMLEEGDEGHLDDGDEDEEKAILSCDGMRWMGNPKS